MNIKFVNAWMLHLIWLVPLLFIWWNFLYRTHEARLAHFVSRSLQEKLRPARSATRPRWQSVLTTLGILLMLLALARPMWGTREVKVFQRGRDLVIALDVSRSMLAEDVHPNRLTRAKTDIMDLVRELKGDRAALLVFGHKAILRCPLTSDYSFLQESLDAVDTFSAPGGETDIGDAIVRALDSFDNESASHKAIILITDGEDLSGRALESADIAGKRNIPIFTVGIGSRHGARIPDKDAAGKYIRYRKEDVITKLHHDSLYNIARKSGGAYVPVETGNMDLGSIYKTHLKQVSAQDLEETFRRRRIERYQLFLLPSILLLLAACFLSPGRLVQRTEDRGQKAEGGGRKYGGLVSGLLACIVLTAQTSAAQTNTSDISEISDLKSQISDHTVPPGREGARKAQKLYRKGKYEKAAEVYIKASEGSTESSQRDFRYNAGVSLYKAGKYREAAEIFQRLASEPKSAQNPYLALGTSFYRAADINDPDQTNIIERAELLKKAGEAFKESARCEKDRAGAMNNLGTVLDQLPAARESAKIAKLLRQYGSTPAPELTYQMLKNQRNVIEGIYNVFTNNSPNRIRQFEHYADIQKQNSDIWIPLKQKILQAATQQAQQGANTNMQQLVAGLNGHIEALRENMIKSSDQLRDLDHNGFNTASASYAGVYHLWKGIAPYPQLLQEDIRLQSNVIAETSSPADSGKTLTQQKEARDLTTLFMDRFKSTVPEEETLPQPQETPDTGSTTNAINPENREKIINYAEMTITAQDLAIQHLEDGKREQALPEEKKAYDLLREIEKLLPKQQKQNQQQNEQQKQNQQQNQQQKEQQQQDTQEQEQENKQQQQEIKPQETTPEEIRKLMEKALEREKAHEAEKQKRKSRHQMPPHERDW